MHDADRGIKKFFYHCEIGSILQIVLVTQVVDKFLLNFLEWWDPISLASSHYLLVMTGITILIQEF